MKNENQDSRGIRATETAFGIIEYLSNHGEGGVSEIARELELAKSTVYDHLVALEDTGYVEKQENTYRLSLKFLELGNTIKNQRDLVDIAKPNLEELAEQSGEVVWLIVEEHGQAVYLHSERAKGALQVEFTVGQRAYLHNIAAGKAILANLPRDRVEDIIDRHGLPQQTQNTITDRETLFQQLGNIRDHGFARNDGEQIEGVRAVAAPIEHHDEVLGAVSVSAAEKNMQGKRFEETIPDLVTSTSSEIEVRVNYSQSEFK